MFETLLLASLSSLILSALTKRTRATQASPPFIHPTPAPTNQFGMLGCLFFAGSPGARCPDYPNRPCQLFVSSLFFEFFDQSMWISLWIKMGITGDKCLFPVDNWRITHIMSCGTLALCIS